MAAPVLHLGATVFCSHLGQATPLAPFPRVSVSSQLVVTLTSPYVIVNCALASTSTPPCVIGQFTSGSTRVLAGGVPLATLISQSTCTPTGNPMLPVVMQTRVLAT